ncbi:MAG: tetratricopeptide repeat protein [Candidatus Edwardsbacteria bacterium]
MCGNSKEDLAKYALMFLLLAFLATMTITKLADIDIWMHLKTGEYILKEKTIPKTDIFTYTVYGRPWLTHEWLFALISFLLYTVSGVNGLIIFKFLLCMAVFFVLFQILRNVFKADIYLSSFILTLTILLSQNGFEVRAQLVTFLFVSLLLFFLLRLKYQGKAGRKFLSFPVFLILLLFFLWANFHFGFFFGLLVLAIFLGGETIRWRIARFFPSSRLKGGNPLPEASYLCFLFALYVSSLFICLLNPATYHLLLLPFKFVFFVPPEAGLPLEFISEYHSIFHPSQQGVTIILYFKIVFLFTAVSFLVNWKNFDPTNFVLFAAFGILSSQAVRFIPLFAIVTAPLLTHNVQSIASKAKSYRLLRAFSLPSKITIVLFLLLIAVSGLIRGHNMGQGIWRKVGLGVFEQAFPIKALDFLEREGITGRIFNSFNLGGYIIGRGHKVFIDSRGDVCGKHLMEEWIEITTATGNFEQLINKYHLDYFVLEYPTTGSPSWGIHRYLHQNPAWGLIYWDDVALVYLRRAPQYEEIIKKNGYKFLGQAFTGWGRDDLPIDDLLNEMKEKLKEDPKCLKAHLFLGYLYHKMGKLENEIKEYQTGLSINPNSRIAALFHNELGTGYAYQGLIEEATKEYQEAIKLSWQYAEPYCNLGFLYEQSGQTNKAIEMYQKALKIKPDDTWAEYHLKKLKER